MHGAPAASLRSCGYDGDRSSPAAAATAESRAGCQAVLIPTYFGMRSCFAHSILQPSVPLRRYHGARSAPAAAANAESRAGYQSALVAAWRQPNGERPFLLDNVWDLLHVLDYLATRPDVDASRVGMTGAPLTVADS